MILIVNDHISVMSKMVNKKGDSCYTSELGLGTFLAWAGGNIVARTEMNVIKSPSSNNENRSPFRPSANPPRSGGPTRTPTYARLDTSAIAWAGSMPLMVDPAKDIIIGATTLSPAPQMVKPKMATGDFRAHE